MIIPVINIYLTAGSQLAWQDNLHRQGYPSTSHAHANVYINVYIKDLIARP